MSNVTELVKNISPAIYQSLVTRVETGRWEDGKKLTDQQKSESLQLVLAYQGLFNDEPEHFTIAKGGELHMEKKSDLKKQFATNVENDIHNINL